MFALILLTAVNVNLKGIAVIKMNACRYNYAKHIYKMYSFSNLYCKIKIYLVFTMHNEKLNNATNSHDHGR